MKFSYNWLQSFFEKKLPTPEKLVDLLMTHSFEIDEVKKEKNDFVLDIDVLPNRMPDCASHIGIAREISAILGYKIKEKKYQLKEDKKRKAKDFIKIEVKDKKLCPRYCARVIEGVKVSSSPGWLKEKIEACGLQSINNIVDATNYIMLETGQPLHAFDADKITGKIIVRRAKNGEKITTLDNKRYVLDSEVLVIADEKQPIAIAGIKGGKKAEITNNTKRIIIESANFERKNIYKSSKRLRLQTDASIRFSAGLDKSLAEEAIDKVVSLIKEVAGGNILNGIVDICFVKEKQKAIELNIDYTRSLLGIDIKKEKILKILKSLGFEIQSQKLNKIKVLVPSFRKDISIEEDLIEEIGRIYGYENFPSKLSIYQEKFIEENRELKLAYQLRELMKSLGFVELYNYSFISKEEGDFFGKRGKINFIELLNPVSKNIKYLRFSLVPNLLKAISLNEKRVIHEFGVKTPDEYLNFFEIGNIFQKNQEKRKFAIMFLGNNDFFKVKGIFEAILKYFRIQEANFEVNKKDNLIWEKNKSAGIFLNGKNIGFLGEISKEVLDFYQIERPVFGFEIDFKNLCFAEDKNIQFKEIPSFPPLIRDISVLVPKDVLAKDVEKQIQKVCQGNFLEKIEIFDVYYLKEKKSISFRLIFRAKNRNLTSKEIDKIQEKIIKEIETKSNWKVKRKE